MISKRVHMMPHQTLDEYLTKIDQPRNLNLVISNERSSFRYKGIVWNPDTETINIASRNSTTSTKFTYADKKSIIQPKSRQHFQRTLFSRQEQLLRDELTSGQDYCEEITEIFERTSVRYI